MQASHDLRVVTCERIDVWRQVLDVVPCFCRRVEREHREYHSILNGCLTGEPRAKSEVSANSVDGRTGTAETTTTAAATKQPITKAFHGSQHSEVLRHLVLLTEHVDRHSRLVCAHRPYSFREGCDHSTNFVCFRIYPKATYVLDCIFNRTETKSQHSLFNASYRFPLPFAASTLIARRNMKRPIVGHRLVTC